MWTLAAGFQIDHAARGVEQPRIGVPFVGGGRVPAIRARQPRARLVLVGDGPALPALRARQPGAICAGPRTGAPLAEVAGCSCE